MQIFSVDDVSDRAKVFYSVIKYPWITSGRQSRGVAVRFSKGSYFSDKTANRSSVKALSRGCFSLLIDSGVTVVVSIGQTHIIKG